MIKPQLHELVASRICHDLISPIGACVNGAELLGMGGGSEEAALIQDSAANASGRVRFFRIAFGQSSASHSVPNGEIKDALAAVASDRLLFDWQPDQDLSRKEAQAIFLAILCLERHNGVLITCDSLQNWTEADAFFDDASAERMAEMGFFAPANVGPGWYNASAPQKSDFQRVAAMSYKHLLSAHGRPLLHEAKPAVDKTLARFLS